MQHNFQPVRITPQERHEKLRRDILIHNPDMVYPFDSDDIFRDYRVSDTELGTKQAFALTDSSTGECASVVFVNLAIMTDTPNIQGMLRGDIETILSTKPAVLECPPNAAFFYSITNNPNFPTKGSGPKLIAAVSHIFNQMASGIILSTISPNWTLAAWLHDNHKFADYINGSDEAKMHLNGQHLKAGVRDFRNGQKSSLSHAARLHLSNGACWANTRVLIVEGGLAIPFPARENLDMPKKEKYGMGTVNNFLYSDGKTEQRLIAAENIERWKKGEIPVHPVLECFVR